MEKGIETMVGPRGAVLAGLMMATTVLAAAEANIANTDAALLACSVAILGALARLMLTEGGWCEALIFWSAISVAILIKGPIVPLIS